MKQFTQNKLLVLLVAILLIANLGLMFYFFVLRDNKPGDSANKPVSDFIQKQLGFNAEQASRFQQLRDQHKAAVKPVIEDMKRLKDSLYRLLQKPQLDDTLAVNLIDKIGERQKDWELMIFHHFQKVRAICDSNQLPQFDSLVHRMVTHGSWSHRRNSSRE